MCGMRRRHYISEEGNSYRRGMWRKYKGIIKATVAYAKIWRSRQAGVISEINEASAAWHGSVAAGEIMAKARASAAAKYRRRQQHRRWRNNVANISVINRHQRSESNNGINNGSGVWHQAWRVA